jgi:hypothetical protein
MIYSFDKHQRLDGSAVRIAQHIDSCGLPLLPVTRVEGFEFNEELYSLKDYILLDYSELFWFCENTETHLFGVNTEKFNDVFRGEEWVKFDNWVKDNPPKLYLKRELLKQDVSDTIISMDYPAWHNPYPIEDREQFNQRPISCFFYWGRSSEYRVRFHADVWTKSNAAVCDNLFYLQLFLQEESHPKKFVTVNVPHYARQPIENILKVNGLSKLSVSMRGSGRKCFRHAESPTNSVMITEENNLAWQFDWVDGVNCIKFNEWNIFHVIEAALSNPNLYDIYVEGVNTANKYHHTQYFPHINKIIKDKL